MIKTIAIITSITLPLLFSTRKSIESDLLLPNSLNWTKDSVNYGVLANGTWINDTLKPRNIKSYYTLNSKNDFYVKKHTIHSLMDSTLIEETDIYRKFSSDSSFHIGLFLNINYQTSVISSQLDTLYYNQKDSLLSQYNQSKGKSTCRPQFFKYYNQFHKIHTLNKEDAKQYISNNFSLK